MTTALEATIKRPEIVEPASNNIDIYSILRGIAKDYGYVKDNKLFLMENIIFRGCNIKIKINNGEIAPVELIYLQ